MKTFDWDDPERATHCATFKVWRRRDDEAIVHWILDESLYRSDTTLWKPYCSEGAQRIAQQWQFPISERPKYSTMEKETHAKWTREHVYQEAFVSMQWDESIGGWRVMPHGKSR